MISLDIFWVLRLKWIEEGDIGSRGYFECYFSNLGRIMIVYFKVILVERKGKIIEN